MRAFTIATPLASRHTPLNDEAGEAAKDIGRLQRAAAAGNLEAVATALDSTSWLHFVSPIFSQKYG
jgi:hypothetical protein